MTFLDAEIAGPSALRVGTLELTCRDAARVASGSAVRIGLRPEEIRVRNIDDATPNQIATKVTSLDFLGSFCRARLKPDAAPGVAILADFSLNLMRDLAVAEG